MPRRNATPKQTGGGGRRFESEVAAYGLAHLLAGRPIAEHIPGPVVRLDTQELAERWHLDDLLLTLEAPSGPARLAISVKSGPQFAGDALPADFVRDAWEQLLHTDSGEFDETHDYLGFVTPPDPVRERDLYRLIDHAWAQDPADLPELLAPDRSNPRVRSFFQSAACPPDLANGEIPPAGRLLRRLIWLPCDFDRSPSDRRSLAKELCRNALTDGSVQVADDLWRALVEIADGLAPLSGDLDRPALVAHLRTRFSLRTYPDHRDDWSRVHAAARTAVEGVRHRIGGRVVLDRPSDLEAVRQALADSGAAVLLGASGVGKTVIARTLAAEDLAEAPDRHPARIIWASAADLERPVLIDGLTRSLRELLDADPGAGGLLVLDRLDRLYDPDAWTRTVALLRHVGLGRPGGWRVLMTCTPEAWPRALDELAASGVDRAELAQVMLNVPSPAALAPVWDAFPRLEPLRRRRHLAPALLRPKLLDLFALRASGHVDLDAAGESHVVRWFWDRLVATGPDRSARAAAALALAEAQADRLLSSVPVSDLPAGHHIALDALAADAIVEINGARANFEHDLYGDWVRASGLRAAAETEGFAAAVKGRLDSPVWHRAVRLFALDLVEQHDGLGAWRQAFAEAGRIGEDAALVEDLLCEATLHSVGAQKAMASLWPALAEGDGRLLDRTLRRLLHSGTRADPRAVERVRHHRPELVPFVAATSRRIYGPYWEAPLVALAEHASVLPSAVWTSAAQVATLWLSQTPSDAALRTEAAHVAVTLGERLLRDKETHRVLHSDGVPDRAVYQALLVATPVRTDDALDILLEAAGRRDQRFAPPPRTPEQRARDEAELERRGLGPVFGRPGPPPPPWPDGPRFRIDDALRHVVLETNALAPLILARPSAARELLLAVLLDEPRARYEWSETKFNDFAFDSGHGWHPPFFTRGPFWLLFRLDPSLGTDVVLRIVHHATDRWAEIQRQEESDPYHVQVHLPDGERAFVGDGRVFGWLVEDADDQQVVTSALMALEQYAHQAADAEEDLTPLAARLLAEGRSTALLGLLVALGQRHPELFAGPLRPLLTVSELIAWSEDGLSSRAWEIGLWGDSLPTPLHDTYREWHTAPYRSTSLREIAESLLDSDASFRADLHDARRRWREALAPGGRHEKDPFVERLVAEFGRDTPAPPREQEKLHPDRESPPSSRDPSDPAEALRHRARHLLSEDEPWDENEADRLWRDAQALNPDVQGRGHAVVVAAAALAARAPHDPPAEREDWARDTLIQAALDESGGIRTLLWGPRSVAFEALPGLWARRPTDVAVRSAVAHLATSLPTRTVKTLSRALREHAEALGLDLQRYVHLVTRRAAHAHEVRAAERRIELAREQGDSDAESQALAQQGRLDALHADFRQRFVTGSLDAAVAIPASTSPPPRPRSRYGRDRERPYRLLDSALWTAGIAALPMPHEVTDPEPWWTCWSAALLGAVGPFAPDSPDDANFENRPGDWVRYLLDAAALLVAEAESDEQARTLWQPILALGPSDSATVDIFLRKWWGYALYRAERPEIVRRWNEMVAFADDHPGWRADRADGWYRAAELWRLLVGFVSLREESWPDGLASFVESLRPSLQRWAATRLRRTDDLTAFAAFLQLPAAQSMRLDGLVWLRDAVERSDGKALWDERGSSRVDAYSRPENQAASLLAHVWAYDRTALRGHPAAHAAFRGLLGVLVARQVPAAFELSERVGRG